ncbi:MAG TPA: alpha/beta hydrolase [Acidimicrobiales bacterium]|nr:alpha/beta hydrolase [Acidimicrobiales bacterium]
MDVLSRNNVRVSGDLGARPMVFAHGFGCDQHMWRFVAPAFEADHRVILFDYVGVGGSDVAAYDESRYATLDGYAQDVIEVLDALELTDVVFVGHSVSSMIGVRAALLRPDLIASLVLVGPSPRYIDDGDYVGGFTADDIDGLLGSLDSNYLGWSAAMAPMIMANPDRPELGAELTSSFCRTDPEIQKRFARVTFLSDSRTDLDAVHIPTLVLQCSEDVIAPVVVGRYVHEHVAGSRFVQLSATGHCPNLSAPEETVEAIAAFVAG